MTATTTLRRHLDDAGIEYSPIGDGCTSVNVGDVSWHMQDAYDGTLTMRVISRVAPIQALDVIGRTASVVTDADEDGVGHSSCSACGRTIRPSYRHCPWCGARLISGGWGNSKGE